MKEVTKAELEQIKAEIAAKINPTGKKNVEISNIQVVRFLDKGYIAQYLVRPV